MFGDSIDFDTSLSLRIFERLTAESLPRRRATLLWICVKGIRRTLQKQFCPSPDLRRSREVHSVYSEGRRLKGGNGNRGRMEGGWERKQGSA